MAETISLPIALLILLAVFGTLVAAGLPLLIAALAMPTVFAVIGLLASVIEMSIFVNNLATMIGLALAIDYSLFMVSRFREELRHHSRGDRHRADDGQRRQGRGGERRGGRRRPVLAGRLRRRRAAQHGHCRRDHRRVDAALRPDRAAGRCSACSGPRVNRLRVPLPSFLRLHEDDVALPIAGRATASGPGSRRASCATRSRIAGPVLALLLIAGIPFLQIQLSTGQNLDDLPPTPARIGFETLARRVPRRRAATRSPSRR